MQRGPFKQVTKQHAAAAEQPQQISTHIKTSQASITQQTAPNETAGKKSTHTKMTRGGGAKKQEKQTQAQNHIKTPLRKGSK
jgi:hypothetical protein